MILIETAPNGGKTAQSINKMVGLMMADKGVILFNSEDEPMSLTGRVVEAFESEGGDLDTARGYVMRVGLYDTDVIDEANNAIDKFEAEFSSLPDAIIFDTNHAGVVREYFAEYTKTWIDRGIEVTVTVNTIGEAKVVDTKLPDYVQQELDRAIEVLAEKPLTVAPVVSKSDPAAALMEFLNEEGNGVI